MAYDEQLVARVRKTLGRRRGITEKKMFGGICFLFRGNMCCGVTDKLLVIRLGPEGAQAALTEPHTRPMDFTGKPMKSMIYVESTGVDSQVDLNKWIQRACDFAKTLPPK